MEIASLIVAVLGLVIAAMAWLASQRSAKAAERSADAAEKSAESSGASARAAEKQAGVSVQQLEIQVRPYLKARPVTYRGIPEVDVELRNDGPGPARQVSMRGFKGQIPHDRLVGPVVGLTSCRYSGWVSASMGGLRAEPEGGLFEYPTEEEEAVLGTAGEVRDLDAAGQG